MLKAICDGINGVVWVDDTQAVVVAMRKRYGSTPGVCVTVEEVDADVRQLEIAA